MKFLEVLNPLHAIVSELRSLRELYELDLASRDKPIYRTTEKPKKDDTEVMYSGVSGTQRKHRMWPFGGGGTEFDADMEDQDDLDRLD